MYVLEIKETGFLGVYKEIQPILDKLNLCRRTFERRMKFGRWESDVFLIRKPDFYQKKSGKGSKRGKMSFSTTKNTTHYDDF